MRKSRGISSGSWQTLRLQALERENYTCQGCGKRGARWEIHHADQNSHNQALDNLVVYCGDCHFAAHYRPKPDGWAEWTHHLATLE